MSKKETTSQKRRLHIVIGGKGGSGKSCAAANLGGYLKAKGSTLLCLDLDPINSTFAKWKGLDVQCVDVLNHARTRVDNAKVEALFATVIESASFSEVIMDMGNTAFLSLIQYFKEIDALEIFKVSDVEVLFHVPLTGGQSAKETLDDWLKVQEIVKHDAKMVAWANEFIGGPVGITVDGEWKPISAYPMVTVPTTVGIVTVKDRAHESDTMKADNARMVEECKLIEEIKNDANWSLFSRSRVGAIVKEIRDQLESAGL